MEVTEVIRCVGEEKATRAGLALGRSEGHLHTDLVICSQSPQGSTGIPLEVNPWACFT